jgi:hypothetical protein
MSELEIKIEKKSRCGIPAVEPLLRHRLRRRAAATWAQASTAAENKGLGQRGSHPGDVGAGRRRRRRLTGRGVVPCNLVVPGVVGPGRRRGNQEADTAAGNQEPKAAAGTSSFPAKWARETAGGTRSRVRRPATRGPKKRPAPRIPRRRDPGAPAAHGGTRGGMRGGPGEGPDGGDGGSR